MALTEGDKILIRNMIQDSYNLIDYCYIRLGNNIETDCDVSKDRHIELIEYFSELEEYEKCSVIKSSLDNGNYRKV